MVASLYSSHHKSEHYTYRCRYGTSESISSTMFGVANSYMQTQMLNNVKNLVTGGGGVGGGGGTGGMQQTI